MTLVFVDDVNRAMERALRAGGTLTDAATDQPSGLRQGIVADPEGTCGSCCRTFKLIVGTTVYLAMWVAYDRTTKGGEATSPDANRPGSRAAGRRSMVSAAADHATGGVKGLAALGPYGTAWWPPLTPPRRDGAGQASSPPVRATAVSHAGRGPSRRDAAAAAAPTASRASARADPLAWIGPAEASRAWSHPVAAVRSASARVPRRRSHPRTVEGGRPSSAAIRR